MLLNFSDQLGNELILICIVEREEETRLWKDNGRGMKMSCNSTTHYASVDCVHILKSVVVSGWFQTKIDAMDR